MQRGVTGKLRIELGQQQERALKSVVLVLQVAQRLEEEPRRHKQQKRQHDLANDERLRPPSRRTAAAGSAVSRTQRIIGRSPRGGNCGGESEQNSGDDRNAEGEQQN